jgi:hypothetical protein
MRISGPALVRKAALLWAGLVRISQKRQNPTNNSNII